MLSPVKVAATEGSRNKKSLKSASKAKLNYTMDDAAPESPRKYLKSAIKFDK